MAARANLPWEYGKGLPPRFDDLAEEVAFGRAWQAKLAGGRWVGVGWPRELGGRGGGPIEHYIVTEELARGRAPELVGRIGVNLVGPTLLAHGTPEQQSRWLPKILDASEIWCQLFSEPGAGSDLTLADDPRRTRRRGGFLLNGQKVWTSYAEFADWGWCLARTDPDTPKSKGISTLVVDMHAPGVEVRPLRQITDESEFNEVFFTDVFVPVGATRRPDERRLAHREFHAHARARREPAPTRDPLATRRRALAARDRTQRVRRPRLAPRLAQAFVEVRMFQLHNWRSVSRTAKGEDPGPVGSINKLWWSEMSKRLHDTAMAVVGNAQPLWRGADNNPGEGAWQRSWLYYQASSIWAGTNEIQRNVVGERVLGLPREPR